MNDKEKEIELFDIENESRNKKNKSNSDENYQKMQFTLSIDKGYTSAAKAMFFGIVRNHSKMAIDAVYSSPTGTPEIFEEVFIMLTSEPFLRAIENKTQKAVTEFLKSYWTLYARGFELLCLSPIAENFLLDISHTRVFAERSIELAANNRNSKDFSLITSAQFFKAVETGDKYSVKKILNGSRNQRSMRFEALCITSFNRKFIINVAAFDMDCLLGSCISFFDWLEGIYIAGKFKLKFLLARYEIADMLLKFEKIVNGVTENGWTALHLAMFQFRSQFESRERVILKNLLKSGNFNVNALTNESETVLHFACRCSVSNEQFALFVKRLLKLHIANLNQRNSYGQTSLMIASETGNVAAVGEILEWRDDDGERVDISAEDENGQTALSLAKQSNNAEIAVMIEQNLFLRAVENGDTETVRTYLTSKESNFEVLYPRAKTDILNDHHECKSEKMEIQFCEDDLIEEPPPKSFKIGFEAQSTLKEYITRTVWLKAIAIAEDKCYDEMLNLLFNDQRFILGFNEDGQPILHQIVAEYLVSDYDSRKLKTIDILLRSRKFSASFLNLQNETIFEIICKIEYHSSEIDDLLRTFLQNGIDLNGRTIYGETLLMLACENRHIDIVDSLIKMASLGYVIDIDAVDNSDKTALMKADKKDLYVALLRLKFISAVKHENTCIVKSMLFEFRNILDIFVKSWSSNQDIFYNREEWKKKSDIWLEAIYIAIKNDTKHSEEILKLLLGCDILLSQEIEAGYSILDELHMKGKWSDDIDDGLEVDDDKKLRLIELLLKSGKITANDRDANGRTALHWIETEKLISLFIRYGADVNRKDNEGRSPLMSISVDFGTKRFPVLRTLLEEAGTLANLDAMDCNGRTALMHAVMSHRSNDAELLLNKGASVNLSDYFGFSALHHALCGDINKFFEFPRNFSEFRKIKELAILFDSKKHELRVWRFEEWSEERVKIVELLLQRPDTDVNLLSNEMLSPLDIAEGQIPEIPSSIKDALKKKGAVLNAFRQRESQSNSDFHLDARCRRILQTIVWIVYEQKEESTDFLKERFQALIELFKEQIISGKDQQGRTALHLTAIIAKSLDTYIADEDHVMDLTKTIVDKLISIGCSVNEPDIFGRTPLHYAKTKLWELLKSKGADASIRDKGGNIAVHKTLEWEDSPYAKFYAAVPRYSYTPREFSDKISTIVLEITDQNDEAYLVRLMNNMQMEINVHSADDCKSFSVPKFWLYDFRREEMNFKTAPRLLWEKFEFAFKHPFTGKINNEVTVLMSAIAEEIERLDPRFSTKSEFVGSSNEGTKLDKPDEFDFCFVLTKFSELCEVSQSPELPTGFVRLKQNPIKVNNTSDFKIFFGKTGILNTAKLNWNFTAVLYNALVNVEKQKSFEWMLASPNVFSLKLDDVKKVINIKMIKPQPFLTISVDIVPCIHIDGWWPDETISNVSDEIKKFGCNLIFDSPQELYPWVPYSENNARISFSKVESDMIKQSCDSAKEAYMIGKMIAKASDCHVSNYIIKNCLFYCIEALTPSSEKASQLGLSLRKMKSKFHKMDRYLWLKCLMKCHLEFVSQDFCPCYFLPTFSSPIQKSYLKKDSFAWIADRPSVFPLSCKEACALYRSTSNHTSESSYQLPAPDPLWERFDRKQLIASLCEIAYK